jgi:hypothetical protein
LLVEKEIVSREGREGRKNLSQSSRPSREIYFSPPARIVWKCGGCSSAATMFTSIF